jgi:hypothetical protein
VCPLICIPKLAVDVTLCNDVDVHYNQGLHGEGRNFVCSVSSHTIKAETPCLMNLCAPSFPTTSEKFRRPPKYLPLPSKGHISPATPPAPPPTSLPLASDHHGHTMVSSSDPSSGISDDDESLTSQVFVSLLSGSTRLRVLFWNWGF